MEDWEKLPDVPNTATPNNSWEALPDVKAEAPADSWEKLPDAKQAPTNFDKAYIGTEPLATAGTVIPRATTAAPIVQPSVGSPAPGQSDKDIRRVKLWSELMVDEGQRITGTDSSGAKVYKQGEYWKGVGQDVGLLKSKEAEERIKALEDALPPDANAWDWLKHQGQIEKVRRESSPGVLDKVAHNTVGAVGRVAQDFVGHPASVGALKTAMLPIPQAFSNMGPTGAQAWASLTPEQQETEYLKELSPEQKEFYLRTKGTTFAQDVMPGKFTTPSAKEMVLRRLLATPGGNQIKIHEFKEKEGYPNITDATIPEGVPLVGGTELAKVVLGTTELGGELVAYSLLSPGIGARYAASEKAAFMGAADKGIVETALGRASKSGLDPKKLAGKLDAAGRKGLAIDVAVQSGAVAAKNKEDVSEGAFMGALTVSAFDKILSLLSRNAGAKKEIMSRVNDIRSKYSLQRGNAEGWVSPGILLPKQSFNEFLKQSTESAKLAAKPAPKKMTAEIGAPPTAQSSVVGTPTAPYSYRTVGYSEDGILQEERYLVDGKTKKSKLVYAHPVVDSTKQFSYGSTKKGAPYKDPIYKTDAMAYADLLNRKHPLSKETSEYLDTFGKHGYMSPEQMAASNKMTVDEMAKELEAKVKKFRDAVAHITNPPKAVEPKTAGDRPGNVAKEPTQPTVEIAGHDIPGEPRFDTSKMDWRDEAYTGKMAGTYLADVEPKHGTQTLKIKERYEAVSRRGEELQSEIDTLEGIAEAGALGTREQERLLSLIEQQHFLDEQRVQIAGEYWPRVEAAEAREPKTIAFADKISREGPFGSDSYLLSQDPTRPLLPEPPSLGNEGALLTVDPKTNKVEITPLIDRTPSKTAKSPRQPVEGDVVHLSDGEPAIVDAAGTERITVRLRDGQKIEVPKSSVSLANENLMQLQEFVEPRFSQKKVAGEQNVFKEPKNQKNTLLRLKKLDVNRVMNATGIESQVEARALLNDMEEAGQIAKSTRPGEWFVKKSMPDAPVGTPAEQNYRVYYGVNETGHGKSGIVRGRDPKKWGNVLLEVGDVQVQRTPTVPGVLPAQSAKAAALSSAGGPPVQPHEVFKKTKLISVPKEDIVPYRPQLGSYDMSTLPQEYGLSHPLPVDTVVMSRASADAVSSASAITGRLAKSLIAKDAIVKGMNKFINHDAWLVPTDVREHGTKLASQPALVKAHTESYQKTLDEMLSTLSVNDVWLSNIMKRRATANGGKLSEQEKGLVRFFANNPELSQEAQQTIRTALTRLKANEQALAPYVGKIEHLEQLRAAGLEDEYATNIYLKYMMQRKDWARFVKEQLPEQWKAAVRKVADRHPEWGAWNTEDEILSILGINESATGAPSRGTAPSGDVKKKLMERTELEKEIKDVLGNLDSASVQIAHSLAITDSMIARIQSWNHLATTPYWAPGPRPDLGPNGGSLVPNNPMFGKAAGGRIHESFDFLTKQQPMREARSAMRTLASVWKFDHVVGGGLAPWVNQVMRNWKYMVFSGGLQEPADFQTFFEAAELMLKYSGNPILEGSNLYSHAMKNGGIGTGFAGSEINKNKAARKVLAAIRAQNGKAGDMWELLNSVPGAIQGGAESAGAAYDAIDRLFKLTAFINNYRRCLAKGMTADDATAFAVMRNNQSFPNFELVAPKVEQFRQGSVAAIAPFLSSKAEDMRVTGTALMRMKDEPDLVARVAGAGLVVGGVAALMREERRANGISDEMVKRGLDRSPLKQQAFRPGAFVWPELDSEGRMQVPDLTQWEDFLIMSQMHERDFAPAAIVRNNLNQLWGEDTLQGAATDWMFNQAGLTVPLAANQQLMERPGDQGIVPLLGELALKGAVPQGPIKMYDALSKSMAPDTLRNQLFREQWTPEQSYVKMAGAPFAVPIGSTTDVARAKELKSNAKQMEMQMYQTLMNTPEHKRDAAWQAQVKALLEIIGEYAESQE